ncbi:MAG: M15 family metallopeptidase [Aeromicrobium sp.]
MNHSEPPRSTADRTRMIVLAVLTVATAAAGFLVWQSSASSTESSSASPLVTTVDVPPLDAHSDGAGLDADLADALGRATADARADGVEIHMTSGRRSPEHQEQLLRDAVNRYGSKEEAARWVATPDTSPHVSGDAIDVGPMSATDWLAQRGAAYGLCQIYANESWHYELRADAVADGCPAMYADPTEDPRMR